MQYFCLCGFYLDMCSGLFDIDNHRGGGGGGGVILKNKGGERMRRS